MAIASFRSKPLGDLFMNGATRRIGAALPMIRKGTLVFVIAKQQLQKCPVQNRLLPVRRDR
jgi:hypothetical protein